MLTCDPAWLCDRVRITFDFDGSAGQGPEPGTLILLAVGAVLLGATRRRFR